MAPISAATDEALDFDLAGFTHDPEPAALACGFPGCGVPLTVLSRREWVDEANNKAAAEPRWHEHSPHSAYVQGAYMLRPLAVLSPAERQECARRAQPIDPDPIGNLTGLPPYNSLGDPLTYCRGEHGANVPIYAVASLGDDRDLCADCRQAKANQGPTSVSDLTGRAASGDVTRQQIGMGVLMACGARDLVKDDPTGLLMFRVGPNGKRLRKVLVRLMPDDTYAVEYGWTNTDPFAKDFYEWKVVEQEFNVYAEDLAATVRRLGDRERY